jgi:DNA-binding transcriptional LysR family regulator
LRKQSAKKPDLNWNDLRHILAVARARALAPAARQLGVNETTVARRIARAEHSLGSKLFDRIEGAMVPTEAGETAVERAERMEVEVDFLRTAASGIDGSAAGTVRVSAIPLLVNRLLMPALQDLYAAHPRLCLQAIAEPRNVSLTKREADIALRLARPEREQKLVARRIGTLSYAVYGPSRRTAGPLRWISYEPGMAGLSHVAWIEKAIRLDGGAPASLTVNDSEVALHAIRAGIGKSLLPCAVGDREPGLSRLDDPSPVLDRELWLLVLPEFKALARIRAVVDWLDELVARFVAPTSVRREST